MTDKKIVYSYNPETMEFIGESVAYESPLEKDVFMIPAFSVEQAPNLQEGMIAKWNGSEWINEEIIIPEVIESTLADAKISKIRELNQKVGSKIYAVYPMQKQINIGIKLNGYTTKDFTEMSSFINPILEFQDEKEREINDCKTCLEVEEISFEELE